MRKIAVVGTGYVGAVVAASLAAVGHEVVGIEADADRLASLGDGIVPFHEPGLPELITAQIERGALSFTDSYESGIAGAEVVFLCVGTPSAPDGTVDMRAMEQAAAQVGEAILDYTVIVCKSTVPVGTAKKISEIISGTLMPIR